MVKKGLGRGLSSLFRTFDGIEEDSTIKEPVQHEQIKEDEVKKEIEIGLIDRNEGQPRKNFDEKALNELA